MNLNCIKCNDLHLMSLYSRLQQLMNGNVINGQQGDVLLGAEQ